MARTELPWLFYGRHVRPYAFAVSLASANLFAVLVTGRSAWATGDPWSWIMAVAAALSAALLWAGFWRPPLGSSVLMQHGLALSAAVFAARGAHIGVTSGAWFTATLSWCWTVASGGAYLLEATTGDRRPDGGRGE